MSCDTGWKNARAMYSPANFSHATPHGVEVNGTNATTKKGQECIWRCSMFIHGGDSAVDKKENEKRRKKKGKRGRGAEKRESDERIHGVRGCR